ncbi:hypothetical protein DPEC_G00137090 [Dallia pectoralis]|uniref:Uncharacterized protein n=1 Tax=Dallia pectoralis TaxID=75939 RepID=A0ACC2GLH6_DALPE|nr:hypothetical protein DPEC_G00137090 [Dallia pectoralis]
MGNGSVERFNRTLGNMIRALPPEAKHDWPRHLQTLTFMYNCTVHETTGFPPFYLMYGRVPRLPVDILFKNILRDPEISSYDRYVVSLTKDLQEAMAIAQEHANKEQNRQAELYNRRGKGKLIAVGDRVLVSNKRERGNVRLRTVGSPQCILLSALIPPLTPTGLVTRKQAKKDLFIATC